MKFSTLLSLSIFPFTLFCQQSIKIDSLLTIINIVKIDSEKVNLLNQLAKELELKGNFDESINYSQEALKLSQSLDFKKGIAIAYNNLGNSNYSKGNLDVALDFHLKALNIRQEINDKKGIGDSYNNIGLIQYQLGNYDKALEYYYDDLKISEELKNKRGMAGIYHNIGSVYYDKKEYNKSLEFYFNAVKINKEIKNNKWLGNNYTNIAMTYEMMNDYGNTAKFYKDAIDIYKIINDKDGLTSAYINIGNFYLARKNILEAKENILNALYLAKEINSKSGIYHSYFNLANCDTLEGNYKNAFYHYQLYKMYKDSIYDEESDKRLSEMQTRFETEKKDNEIKLLNTEKEKERAVAEEKNRKQKIIIWSVACGLLLVILFAALIFRSLRITRKQKQIIEVQKTEVEKSKHIIEEKNKDITDSINYAKRIQQAKLPSKELIYSHLPQSFVLFKPKDIVSGDFYFFYKKEKSLFIASADCTGHGVPGAFMSMIGSEKLDDALAHSADTSEILRQLNRGIKNSLHQTDSNESTRDGMDIALCSVDTDSRVVKFAGANRPLWIIRNGQTVVEEIKATKKAIGGFTEDSQHFDTHVVQLQQGDTFYISTDGYADTFGKDGKKLMTKTFKEILISIQDKSLKEQEHHLDNFIEDWKGGIEQVDDILVIGVRL
ncbi:MAG: tetratricopeptide repeat protein [Bacteroidetes bacterium]|nr:MAG: tetratricopeptide repeat protein [Bacteroidota bacterium]